MRSVCEHHAIGAAALHGNFRNRTLLVNFCAGDFGGDAQRLHKLAIVDLMILRAEHRPSDLSGKMRLFYARGGGRQPFQRQPEFLLKL